jgi:hypothetical protein
MDAPKIIKEKGWNARILIFSLLLITASTQKIFKTVFNIPAYFEIVLVIGASIGAGYMIVYYKNRQVRGYSYLFLLLLGAIFASGFINNSGMDRISKGVYVYFLVPYALIFLLIKPFPSNQLRILIDVFCAVVSINSLIAIYRFFIDPTLGGIFGITYRKTLLFRTGDLSAESIVFGPTMAFCAGFALYLFYKYGKSRYVFVFCLTAVSSILALSRSSLVILSAIIIFFVSRKILFIKNAFVIKSAIVSGLVLLMLVLTINKIPVDSAIREIGSLSEKQEYIDRISTFSQYFKLIEEDRFKKILFGVGPGYIQPSTLGEKASRADFVIESYWITIIGEIGIFGFLIILIIYGKILRSHKYRYDLYAISIAALFFINMLAAPLLGIYTQVFLWSSLMIYTMIKGGYAKAATHQSAESSASYPSPLS